MRIFDWVYTAVLYMYAGLLEAANSSANNRDRSIALVLDADMIVQPGALEKICNATIRKKSFALPLVWQTCHGHSLSEPKRKSAGWVSLAIPCILL